MDKKGDLNEEEMNCLSSGVSQIGLNVLAPAFIPSFLVNGQNSFDTTPTEDTNNKTFNNTDNIQMNNEEVIDDWETNADEEEGEDGVTHLLIYYTNFSLI